MSESGRKNRNVIRLSNEAAGIIRALADQHGRSMEDLASTAIVKLAMWGPKSVAMAYDIAPDELLRSQEFWRLLEREAVDGLRRCREKHVKG